MKATARAAGLEREPRFLQAEVYRLSGSERPLSNHVGDGSAQIMSGTGARISNIQGIAAVIKIYDGDVASGDLTLSLGRDWVGTGTLQHCEFTVVTVDFWTRSRRLLGK